MIVCTSKLIVPKISGKSGSFSYSYDSLSFSYGDTIGIYGFSGSGKSTYVSEMSRNFDASDVSVLFQTDTLLEEITVKQNIDLFTVGENVSDPYLHALQKKFGICELLDRYPRQLSGGQRKRVEIIRHIVLSKKIIILDEPFQGIGRDNELNLVSCILEKSKEKKGVIFIVSHNLDLIKRVSSKILMIRNGQFLRQLLVKSNGVPKDSHEALLVRMENIILSKHFDIFEFLSDSVKIRNVRNLVFWAHHARWEASKNSKAKFSISISKVDFEKKGYDINQKEYDIKGIIYTDVVFRKNDNLCDDLQLTGTGEINHLNQSLFVLNVYEFYSIA